MNENGENLVLTYRGSVYPWHCDQLGHMNVMWYTGKFDEATWNLFALVGITSEYIRQQKLGMAAVQNVTTYKKELFAGDVISIYSRVLEVRERVIRFEHRMFVNRGDLAATTELTAVHLDLSNRKATPFSAAIRQEMHRLIESANGAEAFGGDRQLEEKSA